MNLPPEPLVYALIADLLEPAAKIGHEMPIDEVFPLCDAVAAHTREEGRGRIGRVIMEV